MIPNFLTNNLFASLYVEWRARDLPLPVAMELVIWSAPPQLMYRLLLVQQLRQHPGPLLWPAASFWSGGQRDTASIARAIGVLLSRRDAASFRRIICDTDSSPTSMNPSLFLLFYLTRRGEANELFTDVILKLTSFRSSFDGDLYNDGFFSFFFFFGGRREVFISFFCE